MKPSSILITDDESNIRMMLRTALESDGYTVEEASNGREALDALQHSAPDLMVLDLNMPGLDGMAVLEQMKSLASGSTRPRVVILTAYGSIAAAVKATRLGAVDFLEKPITPTELRQTVRSILTEPELDTPAPAAIHQGEYDEIVNRIRRSLRLADFTSAETLLSEVAERRDQHTAEYFNLLGVLYEAQHKWRLARKCYGKAVVADAQYQPAKINLRRIYEMNAFGRTTQAITLGDEPDDVWFAQLPEAKN
jgi:DNA-binding response OmpR family regulator